MEAKDDHFDPAFPKGPWKSDDEALTEIAAYARNPNTGGGAWGARFQAGMKAGMKASKISLAGSAALAANVPFTGLALLILAKSPWFKLQMGCRIGFENNEWIVESIWPGHFPKSGEGAIKCL